MPLHELRTTDGRAVEIIDPGLHNTHSGPDFFNAKLRIDGTMWVGNVEIHERSADWFMHSHDQDPAYNNVVLHVASVIDADVDCRRLAPAANGAARSALCHEQLPPSAGCRPLSAVP